jgi:integrase
LRTPSETLSLRWQEDIDWAKQSITIQSPKTEHHEGKQSRVIPMFPELTEPLQEARKLAEDGAVYVVDERYRAAAMGPGGWANANLRTQFYKIVRRAGLKPWARLFQNLRSSRETELAERFPIQVVTKWLGNSPNVALKHYLQTTDEHFAKALVPISGPAVQKRGTIGGTVDGKSGTKMARKAAPQGTRTGQQSDEKTPGNTGRNAVFSVLSGVGKVAETGLEPVTPGL